MACCRPIRDWCRKRCRCRRLSYEEACELAYFGAKVIHPQTMTPAMARGLPLLMRNTFNPGFAGTRIDAKGGADGDASGPVKGLTLNPGLALVSLEGAGLIGVPGTAERVFAALHEARISVVMISQGSSEHSICTVVREPDAARARDVLLDAFARELGSGQVQGVQVVEGICVLAAVGDRMAGTPGVAAQLFGALARARVNIRAIAQGASERNISVAIAASESTRALRAAHAAFWLSPQTMALAVIGPGNVGGALLDQLQAALPRLRRDANLDLRLRALATSSKTWRCEFRSAVDWRERMQAEPVATDLATLGDYLLDTHLPHAVIVDCSASNAVAEHYPAWLAAGIHVITPNKQAGAGPLERYAAIREAGAHGAARFRYEATVGAGLPVISTLRDLLDTGDELIAIDGILSGTLAWLFNKFDGSKPFSELVREAHALGYTEPDPRDDLSGMDVARKLVILAREAGLSVVDGRRAGARTGAGGTARCRPRCVHGRPGRTGCTDAGGTGCGARQAVRVALRRAPGSRWQREGCAAGTAERPCLRPPATDRQLRAIHHSSLSRQSPGRAGTRRRPRGHRRRRVLRSVAACIEPGGQAVSGDSARAFSPGSVGNIGVGFDIIGHGIAGIGDTATVRRIDAREVRIAAIRGTVTDLPLEAARNTAGAALISLRSALDLPFGFEVELDKGIPLGSGLGGSAASCVAALVAANALLDQPLDAHALYPHALAGEAVASGGLHGDNVGPMLLGGLVLATAERMIPINVPAAWHCVVVHPHAVLETREARAALAGHYALREFVAQSAHLAQVLLGCERGDAALVRAGLDDVLVEPRRAPLIAGFAGVKKAALDAGAMGASISGAGPSVFAWFEDRASAERAGVVMAAAFAESGLASDVHVTPDRRPGRRGDRMKMVSTRGTSPAVGVSTAIAAGPAPDGGLYMPESFPRFDPRRLRR